MDNEKRDDEKRSDYLRGAMERIFDNGGDPVKTSDMINEVQIIMNKVLIPHLKDGQIGQGMVEVASIVAGALVVLWTSHCAHVSNEKASFSRTMALVVELFETMAQKLTTEPESFAAMNVKDENIVVESEEEMQQLKQKFTAMKPEVLPLLAETIAHVHQGELNDGTAKLVFQTHRAIAKTMLNENKGNKERAMIMEGMFSGCSKMLAWNMVALGKVLRASGFSENKIEQLVQEALEATVSDAKKKAENVRSKAKLRDMEPMGSA